MEKDIKHEKQSHFVFLQVFPSSVFLATHKHSSGFTKVTGGDELHVGDHDHGHW